MKNVSKVQEAFFFLYSCRPFGLSTSPTGQSSPCRQGVLLAYVDMKLSRRFQPSTIKEQRQHETPRPPFAKDVIVPLKQAFSFRKNTLRILCILFFKHDIFLVKKLHRFHRKM